MNEPPSPTRPAEPRIEVTVDDEQSDHAIDAPRWARLAEFVLAAEGIAHGELALTFVDEATIAELNHEHMGADGPTDVLAFPLDADLSNDEASATDQPLLLGDVVICPAVAARNAPDHASDPHPGHPDHRGTLDDELTLLVVHGVLHVLGMDHAEPEETAAMHAAERTIIAAFDPDAEVVR